MHHRFKHHQTTSVHLMKIVNMKVEMPLAYFIRLNYTN
jgi:hypothetical protein